jgi:hypothetical protein
MEKERQMVKRDSHMVNCILGTLLRGFARRSGRNVRHDIATALAVIFWTAGSMNVLADRTFNINDGSGTGSGTGGTFSGATLTITDDGTYTINSSGPTINTIKVSGGVEAYITLDNVDIDVSGIPDACAFEIAATATVHLTLMGDNVLKSGDNKAGLWVPVNATLEITAESDGSSLDVTGGAVSAGIGGSDYDGSGGVITISGGNIKTTSVGRGAGIGGGCYGSGGAITITGGTITAIGGNRAAGIGSGDGDYGSNSGFIIIITGGTVTAIGGSNAAGIGGGDFDEGGNITIMGGTVMATGNQRGAGIGGGADGNCSGDNITISGGTVTATGGSVGGASISGGAVIITGGSVKMNNHDGPQPVNGAGDIVYLNILTAGIPAVADSTVIAAGSVNDIPCKETPDASAGVYGINDVVTDADGKVYFYLTETSGDEPVEFTTSAGNVYGNSYARNNDNTSNDQTLPFLYSLPRVSSVTPSGNSAPLNGNMAITFDRTMDTNVTGTVTLNNTISLDVSSGSWSDGDQTVTISYLALSAGTTYTVSISGFKDVPGREMLANNSYSFTTGTQSYTADVDPASRNFGTAVYGYEPVTPQMFTVTNTGTGTLTGLTAQLEGADAGAFAISSAPAGAGIAPGSATTVGVKPKDGLPAGTYTATLKIRGNNSFTLSVILAFAVAKAVPTADDLDFDLKYVYYDALPHAIPVTLKDANADMGVITVKYDGSAELPSEPGIYIVTVEVAGNANYVAATFELGRFIIYRPSDPYIRRKVKIEPSPYFVTNPLPGTYYVESVHDMVITLTPSVTLPPGYAPYVTTGRKTYPDDKGGVRITANDDGTYTVRILYIIENTVVTITASATSSGSGDTSAERLAADAPKVWSHGNRMYITSATTSGMAYVYNVDGQPVKILPIVAGETLTQTLPTGIYVVTIEGKNHKIIIY